DIANCCGFGGTFSFDWPDVADRMVQWKLDAVAKTGCTVVASDNPGCLMHIRAGARRRGLELRIAHVLELVAERLALASTGGAGPGSSPAFGTPHCQPAGHDPGVQPDRPEPAEEPRVLDLAAAVHHHLQPSLARDPGRLLAYDAELHPEHPGADLDGFTR